MHAPPLDALLQSLQSSPAGLTDAQADAVRDRVGPNSLPVRRPSPWRLLLHQFQDVLIYILLVALGISVVTPLVEGGPLTVARFLDAIVIAAILVLNAALGFVQEYKAEQAIGRLAALAPPLARVRRDGVERALPAAELVPGDVVVVEAGDRVPADGRLIACAFLEADESLLTGESLPVAKDPAPVPAPAPVAERRDMLHAGTLVTRGSAELLVTATGLSTEAGRIAQLVGAAELPETPLQRRLAALGRALGVAAGIACLLVLLVASLRGTPVLEALLVAVSLAVSAVPEGLPAVVTVCFAIGVRRMVRHRVLVRRLDALETLGSVTVICTDKTGTVTRNEMAVVRWWRPDGADDPAPLATALASCGRARLPDLGDPTELALTRWAQQLGAPRLEIDEEEVPFSSEGKLMRTRHGGRSFVKGSSSRVATHLGLDPAAAAALDAQVQAMAADGLRVLAAGEVDAAGARLAGVVGMEDPPREGVREAVADAATAGIRTVLITGDNLGTAQAIAARVGIVGPVMTGAELEALPEGELSRRVGEVAVYARVSPQHKVAICEALLARGEVVAMSGDGVNDAPALKRAHVGVAMGRRGTEVARAAAAIVLSDDHYATIVAAVREGRRIHDNIRKFVLFLLRANLGEMLLIFTTVALGLPLPYLPIHILWVNLMTDGLPALAMSMEPGEPDLMRRPPRPPAEHILSGEVGRLVSSALVGFVAVLAYFLWQLRDGQDLAAIRGATLTLAISIELMQALSSRSRHPLWRVDPLGNPWLLGAVVVVALMHLALLYGPLAPAFHLAPLRLSQWGEVAAFAGAALLVFELIKLWGARRPSPPPGAVHGRA
ncbi:cation-translocating P-type ATPase [Myxococcota bacterium]|nr:cation-translocating P-type ATPase [Myxococcota bacterium]